MITPSNQVLIDYTPTTYKNQFKQHIFALPKACLSYVASLFPIIHWIHRYNLSWLVQDAIAGITVGMLIVPQGIAYAKIANLDPQYGLYTSFVGVTLYCFFGTSKDISIGPITVVSLLVGQAITKVTHAHPDITGPEIAVCLSLFSGLVTVAIGLVRLGILVDFISEPAIAGYMTGSAITISLGQWPKVFGLSHVNTHNPPYLIIYEFFKQIKTIKLDAAFGLVALLVLYVIKIGGAKLSAKMPALGKPLFFLGIMRSGLVVIVGTLISYLINRQHQTTPYIGIIQQVPAGFADMKIPALNFTILKEASGILPSMVIILILEHVSVAKSFGRMNNYTINSNQEILAIGISNIIGSFFGAYPSTGAFSRTAVMARSGAKTPMASVFSGAVVVLALYVLTPAFYYIPEAVLASVVIHAVVDLVTGPTFLLALFKSSLPEFLIYIIAVVVTIFMDVETAIYISVALSLVLMLFRLARPHVASLGRVRLSDEIEQHFYSGDSSGSGSGRFDNEIFNTSNEATMVTSRFLSQQKKFDFGSSASSTATTTTNFVNDVYGMDKSSRYIYVDDKDPNFTQLLAPLPPGIVVVRLTESILYPNASYISETIIQIVKSRTRPGNSFKNDTTDTAIFESENKRRMQDTIWNEPIVSGNRLAAKPYLECVVIDFGAVDRLDATALHSLHSIQHALDAYTEGKPVEWHFCQIRNSRVRQLLIQTGFGMLPVMGEAEDLLNPTNASDEEVLTGLQVEDSNQQMASSSTNSSVANITNIASHHTPTTATIDSYYYTHGIHQQQQQEETIGIRQEKENSFIVLLPEDKYPAFHWDVETAVYSITSKRQHHSTSSITIRSY